MWEVDLGNSFRGVAGGFSMWVWYLCGSFGSGRRGGFSIGLRRFLFRSRGSFGVRFLGVFYVWGCFYVFCVFSCWWGVFGGRGASLEFSSRVVG